jgi:hypothetical protein
MGCKGSQVRILSPRPILILRRRDAAFATAPTRSFDGQNLTENSDARLRQAAMFGAPSRGNYAEKQCRVAVKEFK